MLAANLLIRSFFKHLLITKTLQTETTAILTLFPSRPRPPVAAKSKRKLLLNCYFYYK